MTLETVLKNFTDYVNLGCVLFETVHEYGMENIIRLDYYSEAEAISELRDCTYYTDDSLIREFVNQFDTSDIVQRLIWESSTSDILNELDISDIKDYLLDNFTYNEILEGFESYEVKKWLSGDEDVSEILERIDRSDLLEYISNNYDPDDFIELDWRNY